jgi:hypothetical protein
MPRGVHAAMQDSNDRDALTCHSKIDGVVLHLVSSIAEPNVVAHWRDIWGIGQFLKGRGEHVCVPIRLLDAPLL